MRNIRFGLRSLLANQREKRKDRKLSHWHFRDIVVTWVGVLGRLTLAGLGTVRRFLSSLFLSSGVSTRARDRRRTWSRKQEKFQQTTLECRGRAAPSALSHPHLLYMTRAILYPSRNISNVPASPIRRLSFLVFIICMRPRDQSRSKFRVQRTIEREYVRAERTNTDDGVWLDSTRAACYRAGRKERNEEKGINRGVERAKGGLNARGTKVRGSTSSALKPPREAFHSQRPSMSRHTSLITQRDIERKKMEESRNREWNPRRNQRLSSSFPNLCFYYNCSRNLFRGSQIIANSVRCNANDI